MRWLEMLPLLTAAARRNAAIAAAGTVGGAAEHAAAPATPGRPAIVNLVMVIRRVGFVT